MIITRRWLEEFINISNISTDEICKTLNSIGLEVDSVEKKSIASKVVVAKVLSKEKHPDADKLNVCQVDLGDEVTQIVCGASNVEAGQTVAVATIGAILGNDFKIKAAKLRGVESNGMICSSTELGLPKLNDGIMVLDASLQPGTSAATVFKIENDEVFEIGLTPNRADAMSHFGTARDLRAGMLQSGVNVELITPSVSNFRVDKRTLKIDIDVKESKLVPRYCGVTISGITVKPSPTWLQNRLKAIGLNPKNNIVDVTNYVLHELGQPLHAFDAAKISRKVIVKTMPSGTKFTTLDDVERSLHEEDIMICDENGPLCIAGVFGGKESGVSESTTAIFLESAYFNPVSVRKTAKRHQLNTDASFRFERGIDPSITEYALKRAALLIQEVAGGEITSDIIDVYPKKVEDFSVFLNFNKVTKIIGQEIQKDIIKKMLVSLDIKVNNSSDAGLGLIIPSYRVDVQREVDVIEEILRVYGYNNIKISNKVNATVSKAARTEDYKIQNIVATQLNAQGFHEMMANSLTTPEYIKLTDSLKEEFNVHILNPLSTELSTMRQSLLFSGLEAISYNINRKNSDLKLFEYGKSYKKSFTGYSEKKHLSLFTTGNRTSETWKNSSNTADFFFFKGYVTGVLHRSVLKPIGDTFSDKTVDFHTGNVSEVTITPCNDEDIANTVAVMGGEDWQMWMDALLSAGVLAEGAMTVAYSYIGPKVTEPVYRKGTIGMAKDHLESTAFKITEDLAKIGGKAFVSVNKALVTQASSAIPVIPLYISLLYKIMKAKGTHEGCIEQIQRLFSARLYTNGSIPVDEKGRIRIDDWEMDEAVQKEVAELWKGATTENLPSIGDLNGYKSDFLNLFGFGFDGVDYAAEANEMVEIPGLITVEK